MQPVGRNGMLFELAIAVAVVALITVLYFRRRGNKRGKRVTIAVALGMLGVLGIVFLVGYVPKASFFRAIKNGDVSAVESALSLHPEWLEARELSLDRDTPLGVAVRTGSKETVMLLLKKGAEVGPDVVIPPLAHAAFQGETEIGRLLIEHGADPNQTGFRHKNPSIQLAAGNRHLDFVRMLFEHKVDVNACDTQGGTALMTACERGHAAIVNLLLQHGADVNASNRLGSTPLTSAAEKGHISIVRTLLAHDADVNAAKTWRKSALARAAANGRLEVVRVLLEHGATVSPGLLKRAEGEAYLGRKYREIYRLLKEAANRPGPAPNTTPAAIRQVSPSRAP